MTRSSTGFLAEAKHFLTGWIGDLRGRRDHRNQLEAEAALAIVRDAQAEQGRAVAQAHSAETHDLEAARLLRAAQHPASPGGRTITPREAAPIHRLILRSAKADHELGEQLA